MKNKTSHLYKSGLIIIENDDLLVVRKENTYFYLLPGGLLELGETDEEALLREIYEELSCGLVEDSLAYFGTFEEEAANEPDSIIHINTYFGQLVGQPSPNSEIVEVLWFGKGNNQALLSPIIRNSIWPTLAAKGYLSPLP
jgi:8-oxo-dGTP diphosphatase